MLPFKEKSKGNISVRTFSNSVNETELKWHWDNENRIVVCEHETDWQLQMDNQLPVTIAKNKKYFIPEGEYHRIIKGSGDLTVKVTKLIKEYDDEEGYHAIIGHFPDQEDKHNYVLIYRDNRWDLGIVKNKETNDIFLVNFDGIDSEYQTDYYYQTTDVYDLDQIGYSYEAANEPELEQDGIELFVKHAVENPDFKGKNAKVTDDFELFNTETQEDPISVIRITTQNRNSLVKTYKGFFIDFFEEGPTKSPF